MHESLVSATRGLRQRTIGLSSARPDRRRQFFHMRCFTDDELRRGLDTVILEWDRCTVCGAHSDQAHRDEASDHAFQPGDLIDVFLKGVSQQPDNVEP
jgi:hypothetical protein